MLQEIDFNDVDNNAESSDSEAYDVESDGEGELSFESDEDGFFVPTKVPSGVANKGAERSASTAEDDVSDDDSKSLDEESGESGSEEIDSDDIEDISDSEGVEEADSGEDSAEEEAGESDEESSTEELDSRNGVDRGQGLVDKAKSAKLNGAGPAEATTNGNKLPNGEKKVNALAAFQKELISKDEYADHDTSDEEDIRNTVGNIPMHWYDEYKHIGYDWDAKKIVKPPQRDQLDDFLKRMEDPNFWRTVKDPKTGQEVVLSEADIELIKRINAKRIPDSNYEEYAVGSCKYSINNN